MDRGTRMRWVDPVQTACAAVVARADRPLAGGTRRLPDCLALGLGSNGVGLAWLGRRRLGGHRGQREIRVSAGAVRARLGSHGSIVAAYHHRRLERPNDRESGAGHRWVLARSTRCEYL